MSIDGGLHEGSVPFAAHSDYVSGCVPLEGMYAAAVFGARGVPQLPVADVAVQVLQRVLLVLAAEMVNAEVFAVAVGPMGAHIRAARHGCSSGTQWKQTGRVITGREADPHKGRKLSLETLSVTLDTASPCCR